MPGTFGGVAAATVDSVNPSRDRRPGQATVVSVTGTTDGVTAAGAERSAATEVATAAPVTSVRRAASS
jgi:hypothetical protein